MSKILFTEKDIEKLKNNKNVARVSEKSITYTFDLKRLFIDEYIARKIPRDIFIENGFDIELIGIKRVEQSANRWKRTYDKGGIIALDHSRKISSSRRGNCWDNAPQESFFGHLKDSVKSKKCNSYEELKSEIDKYIIYYNNYRYKWNQKKMTPVQYRNHLLCA